jgi:hypothetical protein
MLHPYAGQASDHSDSATTVDMDELNRGEGGVARDKTKKRTI